MLKFRDVMSRWERRELSQLEAAEVLGISERQFRRWRDRYEEHGELGLRDHRLGKAPATAIPAGEVARLRRLYQTMYKGWNVTHFHEHGVRDHKFTWSYTWTKTRLQAAGLVTRAPRRGAHRRKRERKPLEGMMLHQDGSRHAWLEGVPELDLIVTMDDATSTIYSAFLIDEEGTMSSFRGLLEVLGIHGLPSSLYTDRGSHYFHTPEAGGAVDKTRPTQLGRALARLGVEHIPAYSPEARGRSERMFGTLQDRLVKELRLAQISEIEAANRWIRDVFLPAHNVRFARPAAQSDTAFVVVGAEQLVEALCIEEARVVGRDNTAVWGRVRLQLPATAGRAHYVKANVKVRQYPDDTLAVFHGPRRLARYAVTGELLVETGARPGTAGGPGTTAGRDLTDAVVAPPPAACSTAPRSPRAAFGAATTAKAGARAMST